MTNSKTLLLAFGAAILSEVADARSAPWTCQQLEIATDPYYRMFPAYLGSAYIEDATTHANRQNSGRCFGKIKIFTDFKTSKKGDKLSADVTFQLDDNVSIFCMEHLQVSTSFTDHYDFYVTKGQKPIHLEFTDSWEIADVEKNGLRFFTYCADPFTFLESTVTTAFMWIGGNGTSKYLPAFGDKPTNYQKEANSRFIEQFAGTKLQERIINYVEIDQAEMQTGDILVGRRFSGNAAEWMMLSGGLASHVAMIVEGDHGRKYVVDCPAEIGKFSKVGGVAKTELSEWLDEMVQADYEVAWLPLNKSMRSYTDFDTDKLNLWIKQHLGMPYSRVAAFFAAVDTQHESFPAPLNSEIIPVVLRLYNQYSGHIPEVAGGKVMDQLVEALDKRVRQKATADQLKQFTKPKIIEDVVEFAAKELDLSLLDLMAMPEQDDWRYDHYSGKPVFTPASFVVGALKQLGVFHDLDITAAEFTVTDVYQLDIYEKEEADRDDLCREADYGLPFCQLFGTYRLQLPGFSTVHPYSNMNELCPNQFESRVRPDGC